MGVLGTPAARQVRIQRQPRWFEGRKGHNRVIIAVIGAVALLATVYGATAKLTGGDTRQVVVTMQQGITQADRLFLKDQCGHLPGIRNVADKGPADLQYRFSVRFDIGGTSTAQESALYACVNRFPQLVRGIQTENDDI